MKWKLESPVGVLLIESRDGAVIRLKPDRGEAQKETAAEPDAPIAQAVLWLRQYFEGKAPEVPLPPLAPEGTEYQRLVWHEMLRIPYGGLVSYRQLAAQVSRVSGRKTSPRAIGSAVGRNPIMILLPCHRVVGADGSLTGYAGGLWRKEKLLTIEKTNGTLCNPF